MTLRRKLLVAFGGLAILALLAASVTVYLTARWQGATQEMRAHYTRSLLLQSVRAETFQALAEVNDALAGDPSDYADARGDFERAIAETETNFSEWRTLAGDLAETTEVLQVRAVYERLTTNARQVFDLLDAGQRAEAVRLVDDELDTGDYARFQEVTELAAAADARAREAVTAASEDLRITALIMSAVIAIAALSLTLLIAAYLAQDLFRPLQALGAALQRLPAEGGRERLPVDRADEFGIVAAAFNRTAEAFECQGQAARTDAEGPEASTGTPQQVVHSLLARIRSNVHDLTAGPEEGRGPAADRLNLEIESLSRSLALAVPTRLRLAPVDPRRVAQEALAAIAPILAERGISCECEFEPEETIILADLTRLRDVLAEMLRDALAALPEKGGRIGIRVREADRGRLHVDVATSGGSAARADEGDETRDRGDEPGHFRMMRQIVEEHGGAFRLARKSGGAAVFHAAFPVHRPEGQRRVASALDG